MKHFKLNIKYTSTPVADLDISKVPEKDFDSVAKAFVHALVDSHIAFDYIDGTNTMLVAKKKEVSWSISE